MCRAYAHFLFIKKNYGPKSNNRISSGRISFSYYYTISVYKQSRQEERIRELISG